MKSIVLIGFMGTGKTTVGKLLAEALGVAFVDLDAMIVEEQRMAIDEIFAQYGETVFRQLEQEALSRIVQKEDVIISPGGGAILYAENRAVMKQHSLVIGLTARPEVILRRVDADAAVRPVLENRASGQSKLERIVEVLAQRELYYRQADLLIDTSDQSAKEITEQILNRIKGNRASLKGE